MGGSSNGKLEATQEIQHQSQDEDVGNSKPVVDFIKKIDIGDDYDDDTLYANMNMAIEDQDESPPDNNNNSGLGLGLGSSNKENNHKEEDSREMVEDKEASESIAVVELPIEIVDSDTKEIKEKPIEIDELVSKGIEESKISYANERYEFSAALVDAEPPKGIEETELPSADDKNEEHVLAVTSKTIEGTGSQTLKENNSAGKSSGTTVAYARDQYVKSNNASEESERPAEVLEDTANPSIVHVTRRPLQPTSWRSCCGIFEVLPRSRR